METTIAMLRTRAGLALTGESGQTAPGAYFGPWAGFAAPVQASTQKYDYIFKIVLAGDGGVGKSSVVKRFVEKSFDEDQACTIGVDLVSSRLS